MAKSTYPSEISNIGSDSDEDLKAPRPKPRLRLTTPSVPPRRLCSNEANDTSTLPPLPQRISGPKSSNFDLNDTTGVSSTIRKFENIFFKHNDSNSTGTLKRIQQVKPPETKTQANISGDVDTSDEHDSPEDDDMHDEYVEVPMYFKNDHVPKYERSISSPMHNHSPDETETYRNTISRMHTSALYADQKYMDLYSIIAENSKDSTEIIDPETKEKYKEAYHKLLSTEHQYNLQLQKINILFNDNRTKFSIQTLDKVFGNIKGLLNVNEKMMMDIKTCETMPELATLIMKMESDFDIYINDKWLKVTKCEQNNDIFLPYNNWAATHLEYYNHILKQLRQFKNPAIILASIVINETIDQCKAIDWLSEIEDFQIIREAGKFILKDTFKIKVNGKDKGTQEAIFLEKYILCVSSVNYIKKCIISFEVSKIMVEKKNSNTLVVNYIGNKKSTIFKSPDTNVIDTWYNRYLLQAFMCMKQLNPKK